MLVVYLKNQKSAYLKNFGDDVEMENGKIVGKPIAMYDPNTDKIKRYKSVYELRSTSRITHTSIYASISEERPLRSGNFKGYQFFEGDMSDKEIRKMLKNSDSKIKRKKVPIFVKYTDGTVERFETLTDCSKKLNVTKQNIQNFAAKNGLPVHHGRFEGMIFSKEEIK